MKIFVIGLIALFSTTFVFAQTNGEDIDLRAAKSQTKSETSETSESRKYWSFSGREIEVNQKFRNTSESWGKTQQDVEAEELRLKQLAISKGESIVDHTARIDGRTYDMHLNKRRVDGIQIQDLARPFTVRMVHRSRKGVNYWATGSVDADEVLIGKKVGYQLDYKLLDDGRVEETRTLVYQVASCYRCDNPTTGLVYSRSVERKHFPVLVEESIRKQRTEKTTYLRAESQPAPVVYNIMVSQFQGSGPIMNPTTQYFGAPMAPFYLIRGRDGKCRVVCDTKYCDPKDRPDLPPPPPPPGGDGGTPPNNDEGRLKRGG